MAPLGLWPLQLLLAALGTAGVGHAGQTNLMSPYNVRVRAINTNFTLRWKWDSQKDFNVTFSAQCQRIPEDEDEEEEETDWKEISGCQNITVKECDISSAITDYYSSYNVCVRAEKGERRSPCSIMLFRPYLIAEIGPPGVQLESIDGGVKITISPPEENQSRKMWPNDIMFTYNAEIWERSSRTESKNKTVQRREIIYDLAPDTDYCLRVQARITTEKKVGSFSPVYCVKTAEKALNVLPYPIHVKVHALNMKFFLTWHNQYDQNVSFIVQYLSAYLKSLEEDHSDKWITVSGCENITTTQCDFSDIISSGIYFLRVQAIKGYNKSRWSKEIKVDPCVVSEIGPPRVAVNSSENSLRIQLIAPGGFENKFMTECDDLSYQILYWENSSALQKSMEQQQLLFTISDLKPVTLYCLKVQAFSQAYQKKGHFSEMECIRTLYANTSPLTILTTFAITMISFFFLASALIFCIYYTTRRIKYTFFPSCKPPANIECLGGQPFKSLYLLTSEEPTENCCIIENNVIEETNQTDFKDYKHSKQSSRDSGNYSNDDDSSGTKVSEEMQEQETA